MTNGDLNWIANFLWGIADDILRDLYVRGKYRDVILPMTVLRRLDAVLEPTKQKVIETKASLDKARIANQDAALRAASGQAFYNTSKFLLRDLKSRANQQQLKADFEAYLDGFSPNVQEIFDSFEFRNQIPRLSKADVLGTLIERFLDPSVNLSPEPVRKGDGSIKHPGLDNHAMGTIFEELVRRFNEENNEEAGEHWTPRDAVRLMAKLVFLPIADQIESGTYLVYDGACGTGGMLSVAEETLQTLAAEHDKQAAIHLYGQEINAETYAIAKGDLLLKGAGEAADNLVGGPEHSTLSNDAFPSHEFDFMLSNPPYGKSWKTDLERMGGKEGIKDQRFVIQYAGEPDYSLVTRSSDGQMLFLVNMLSKMKHGTKLGSRIAEVHNGSSLLTGDAGQGESNIRRWIIENDWLEAIVALPLNMFYNTGIATYIWVLSNRKPTHRAGKVQLIDATAWYEPLPKNLGKKNCKLSDQNIERIVDVFLRFDETPESRVFDNAALGYWKVVVERPLRLRSQLSPKSITSLLFVAGDKELRSQLYDRLGDRLFDDFKNAHGDIERILNEWSPERADDDVETPSKAKVPDKVRQRLLDPKSWQRGRNLSEIGFALRKQLGGEEFGDHNAFRVLVDQGLNEIGQRLPLADKNALFRAVSWPDQLAPPVIARVVKKQAADPLRGRFAVKMDGKACVVEYEHDPELRDSEQVPLLEPGGVEAFILREVMPYTPDAWIDEAKTQIGYEVSFSRYFYKPRPLRSLEEIREDILAVDRDSEELLAAVVGASHS